MLRNYKTIFFQLWKLFIIHISYLLKLMVHRTVTVLGYFWRMNLILFLNDFCYVNIMNLCLLSWEISWNLWSLKIFINLLLFLSWNIFCILIYNDLTLLIGHTWLIDSFIWLFSLNVLILLVHPIHGCVIITFNCAKLLMLVLFL